MIVLPMAGNSSRFAKAGYGQPKYMLELGNSSVLERVLLSFEVYFENKDFLFICRRDHEVEVYVKDLCEQLGIKFFTIVVLDKATEGQAETVYLGLRQQGIAADTAITIFNIDTFRPGFELPLVADSADGYLEVFMGEGGHWSFIEPGEDQKILRTTEKDPISNFAVRGFIILRNQSFFTRLTRIL